MSVIGVTDPFARYSLEEMLERMELQEKLQLQEKGELREQRDKENISVN